ncbi:pterin 4 alpha carbinolamine dehydratase-domain-containing protein [Dactylonectria macrodidyma]|uniref:4a-hydroxytetrahydrobiopterin dehydratase n=1 Tax=Dactylonectria macrodidyma TaxID=307937 RepID=A0A9P9JFR9_9HYPO|nr:pterin 4 alpha carbinolamine dehydratase-domain-containing protein [Dactylonectria macrodidyma]
MPLPRVSSSFPSLIRTFSSCTSTMAAQPRFSAGTDAASVTPALTSLLSSSGGRWALTNNGAALERRFRFKTFAKTWDFMTGVSLQCKIKNHHPEWSNVYNTTFIRWTTHNPAGLSEKDIIMAAECDALASELGELAPEPDTDQSCAIKGLADQTAAAAGDCCTPNKK